MIGLKWDHVSALQSVEYHSHVVCYCVQEGTEQEGQQLLQLPHFHPTSSDFSWAPGLSVRVWGGGRWPWWEQHWETSVRGSQRLGFSLSLLRGDTAILSDSQVQLLLSQSVHAPTSLLELPAPWIVIPEESMHCWSSVFISKVPCIRPQWSILMEVGRRIGDLRWTKQSKIPEIWIIVYF